jgi:hypothetical protein
MLHGCVSAFSRMEGGIQALAGLAQSCQTVGSFLRTPGQKSRLEKIWQEVSSANSPQWKDMFN